MTDKRLGLLTWLQKGGNNEKVEVSDLKWADTNTTYEPSIRTFGYYIRSEWLAKQFLAELIEENIYYDENYQLTQTKFDESWLLEEETHIDFFARKANIVYRINYYGEEPAKKIIEAAEIKAGY